MAVRIIIFTMLSVVSYIAGYYHADARHSLRHAEIHSADRDQPHGDRQHFQDAIGGITRAQVMALSAPIDMLLEVQAGPADDVREGLRQTIMSSVILASLSIPAMAGNDHKADQLVIKSFEELVKQIDLEVDGLTAEERELLAGVQEKVDSYWASIE